MEFKNFFNIKWFYPGMKIKRWLLLLILGILLFSTGLAGFLFTLHSSNIGSDLKVLLLKIAYTLDLFVGIWLIIQAIKKIFRSVIGLFLPQHEAEFIDIAYQKRQLARGPKIVVIGGGTGLSTILHGLKQYTLHNTAVVTVADNGGSSGKLREQLDILPPGDIRNCLVALADTEQLVNKLFQFRFSGDSELAGHNFGNLFIAAMTQLTGDFGKAIKESSKVLAIRGNVVPSTLSKINLVARYKDGREIEGETNIPKAGVPIDRVWLNPESVRATPEAISAIESADIIVLGPGSLYTSIIPNLLIKEITDAIVRSKALKFYICNIMTQPGETEGYSAAGHIKVLSAHSHPKVIDYCIINNGSIPQNLVERYKKQGSTLVFADADNIRGLGYKVIEDNLVNIDEVVRHNATKLSQIVIKYYNLKRRKYSQQSGEVDN